METQPIIKLAEALSKAQSQFKTPKKTQSVTYSGRSFMYADLADVIEATKEALGANGLATTHVIEHDEKGTRLVTSVIHASGEHLKSIYPLPDASKTKPQDVGAALTYARRYSLSAILGIASEADTDGNKPDENVDKPGDNVENPKPDPKPELKPKEKFKPLTPVQNLGRLKTEKKMTDQVFADLIIKMLGKFVHPNDMTAEQVKIVTDYVLLK